MSTDQTSSTALALVPGATATPLTDQDWTIAVHRANWMHKQCQGMDDQRITLEKRYWMTAVMLGALLTKMKASCQHGEWGKLFTTNDKNPNSERVQNFHFSQATGNLYSKIYKGAVKKARKLKGIDIALIETAERNERTYEEISKLSDATSIREALQDLSPSPARKKQDPFGGKRNENGGPRKEDQPEVSPAERLDAERKAADDAISEICTNLARFQAQGRLPLVSAQKLAAAKTLLSNIIEDILNIKYSD